MDRIIEILNDVKPGVDYINEKHLVSGKILDSMSIVRLVMELSDAFDVEISPLYIVPENFESAEAIKNLIDKCEEE